MTNPRNCVYEYLVQRIRYLSFIHSFIPSYFIMRPDLSQLDSRRGLQTRQTDRQVAWVSKLSPVEFPRRFSLSLSVCVRLVIVVVLVVLYPYSYPCSSLTSTTYTHTCTYTYMHISNIKQSPPLPSPHLTSSHPIPIQSISYSVSTPNPQITQVPGHAFTLGRLSPDPNPHHTPLHPNTRGEMIRRSELDYLIS